MITKAKLKVMTVVGTRPEIIRLSRVMSLLDQYLNQVIVHTGQNYDYELNEIFWKELELRRPDYFLNVDTSSLGATIGDIMRKTEEVLLKEKPGALLVLGDTNSCLSAYMAKRMHIPIFHMEAGNRSFDLNVPEEVNRRIIDHIADFNLVYTEHARRHLLSEGLPHRRIYLTGSPMKEVIDYYKPKIDRSDILTQLGLTSNFKPETLKPESSPLTAHCYFLVSVHREENVDNPENLQKILVILEKLAEQYNLPVIVSTHPRTRKRIESLSSPGARPSLSADQLWPAKPAPGALVSFLKPFGFIDYVHLEENALCTISDSGTTSEESAILSFPAVSLRQSMERPEAQDAGTIILTGFDPEIVLSSIAVVIAEFAQPGTLNPEPRILDPAISSRGIPDYSITDTSWRVLKLILGNTGLSNLWHGVRS
jgi:UDP-N-acetylglucosamine 2-epimerase